MHTQHTHTTNHRRAPNSHPTRTRTRTHPARDPRPRVGFRCQDRARRRTHALRICSACAQGARLFDQWARQGIGQDLGGRDLVGEAGHGFCQCFRLALGVPLGPGVPRLAAAVGDEAIPPARRVRFGVVMPESTGAAAIGMAGIGRAAARRGRRPRSARRRRRRTRPRPPRHASASWYGCAARTSPRRSGTCGA